MTNLPPSAAPEPEQPSPETAATAPVEPQAPSKPKRTARQTIILVVVVVVVAIVAWVGTTWLLGIVAPKDGADSSTSEEGAPDSAPEGYVYTNDELGFTVTLPGKPQENSSVQQLGGFDIPMTQVQWAEGSNLAGVAASQFPDEVMAQDQSTMLTNSIAGAASSTGGTVSDEVEAVLDGAPAHRAVLTLSDGQTAEILVAFQGNMQISVIAGGDISLDDVISSFSFTG